jgi:hypothetical protein
MEGGHQRFDRRSSLADWHCLLEPDCVPLLLFSFPVSLGFNRSIRTRAMLLTSARLSSPDSDFQAPKHNYEQAREIQFGISSSDMEFNNSASIRTGHRYDDRCRVFRRQVTLAWTVHLDAHAFVRV